MSISEKKTVRRRLMDMINERRDQAFAIADYIFQHPETSMKEYESSAYLAGVMKNEGFDVEYPYCGIDTAFKATKKNGDGPRICFLAEYDALPGSGHACGHQWIGTVSAMSGIVLADALKDFPGEVTVFGTPGEETGEGKPVMVEAGAFDGYNAALEIHGNYATTLAPVVIGIGGIDIEFFGKAAHAGEHPWYGKNALDAVIQLFNSINSLRQQTMDGTRIHGIITNGGDEVNTVPAYTSARIEYRSPDQEYLEGLLKRIVACAEGAALATGCTMKWAHFEPTCEALITNPVLMELCRDHLPEFPELTESGIDFAGGASDTGNVSQVIPTFHPMIKMAQHGEGCHTEAFRDALLQPYAKERAIDSIKLLTEIGLDLLADPELAYSLKVR